VQNGQIHKVPRDVQSPRLTATEKRLDAVNLIRPVSNEGVRKNLGESIEYPANSAVAIIGLNGEVVIVNQVHQAFHQERRHIVVKNTALGHIGAEPLHNADNTLELKVGIEPFIATVVGMLIRIVESEIYSVLRERMAVPCTVVRERIVWPTM
jgi:hypothetical protein